MHVPMLDMYAIKKIDNVFIPNCCTNCLIQKSSYSGPQNTLIVISYNIGDFISIFGYKFLKHQKFRMASYNSLGFQEWQTR